MIERKSKMPWVIGILSVAIIVVGGLGWWIYGMFSSSDGVMHDRYQAVFLTNNQVYFGKISNVNSDYVDLKDIYYLQVQQTVQPTDGKSTEPKVALAQLGTELHAPENHMRINRDQILFWENLTDTGKVIEAIKRSKEAAKKAQEEKQ